jgi:hypothetical protein
MLRQQFTFLLQEPTTLHTHVGLQKKKSFYKIIAFYGRNCVHRLPEILHDLST